MVIDQSIDLEYLQRSASFGYWEWDIHSGQLTWSRSMEALYGVPPGCFARTLEEFYSYVHPDDRGSLERLAAGNSSSPSVIFAEFRIVWPDGTIRWMESRGITVSDDNGYPVKRIGINIDITDKKENEVKLKEAEERLQIALQASGLLVFHQNENLRYTWIANPKLGASGDDLIGRTDEEIMGLQAAAPLVEIKRRALVDGTAQCGEIFVTNNGKSGWFELIVQPLRHQSGLVTGILCAAKDVTERKEAEEKRLNQLETLETLVEIRSTELKREKEHLELALQSSNLGSWDSDRTTGNIIWDSRACELLGYKLGELSSERSAWWASINLEDRERVSLAIQENERGDSQDFQLEYRVKHKLGHWVWVSVLGRAVSRDEMGNATRLAGTIRDITPEKRMAEQGADLLKHIETLMNDVVTGRITTQVSPGISRTVLDDLPRRQRQILIMVAQGMTSAEIAQELQLGIATVTSHRRALIRRLNLHGPGELTRFAVKYGLLKT